MQHKDMLAIYDVRCTMCGLYGVHCNKLTKVSGVVKLKDLCRSAKLLGNCIVKDVSLITRFYKSVYSRGLGLQGMVCMQMQYVILRMTI